MPLRLWYMADTQEKTLMKAYGKRVAELRRKRGMTQEQLAAKIDTHVRLLRLSRAGRSLYV
jgi:ribosome-binding protein aMBF1 (putative translation factor)